MRWDLTTFSSLFNQITQNLNQQFSKDPDLSRWVVPRWSDNEDPSFSERIAIH